jgi:FlaA1/EpsC-like NDP-sugar epimerase
MNNLRFLDNSQSNVFTFFDEDFTKNHDIFRELISGSKILVIGGAGSIGQSVTKLLFEQNPKILHVIDLSENNLVELVRDLRSSLGYIDGEFKTFAISTGSNEFKAFSRAEKNYDYIFNLSAMKHVRSEKDVFTLMRLLKTNILDTVDSINDLKSQNLKKYFCVSTDKAANPANLMGASKRIMEIFLARESNFVNISTARFANVAFSDGSLLYGFKKRIEKNQPLSAPKDIKRYFISHKEAGQLCLLSGFLGENRDIFFPKLTENLHLFSFKDIAINFLEINGYEPLECLSEEEARQKAKDLKIDSKKWPCFFFNSDTQGEKPHEEFFTSEEEPNFDKFKSIGIVKNIFKTGEEELDNFINSLKNLSNSYSWNKKNLERLIYPLVDGLEESYVSSEKNLDQKM